MINKASKKSDPLTEAKAHISDLESDGALQLKIDKLLDDFERRQKSTGDTGLIVVDL